jgi:two-component system, OmpR family, sensor histidine kinase KdpD
MFVKVRDLSRAESHRQWRGYLVGFVLASGISLGGYWIGEQISPRDYVMLYLLSVVAVALRWGRGPSIATSVVSVFLFDFFVLPPVLSITTTASEEILTLLGMITVSLIISTLTSRMREDAQAIQRHEAEVLSLYSFSQELASQGNLEQVLSICARHIETAAPGAVAIFLPRGARIEPRFVTTGLTVEQAERDAAQWVWVHKKSAGCGTPTFPDSPCRYLPLVTPSGSVGVLAIRPILPRTVFGAEEVRLLETFATQSAASVERILLEQKAHAAQLLEETYRLQKALLDSVSHDLRTPLASITGALTLLENPVELKEAARLELVQTARQEADRLNAFVDNLLAMTRLELGAVKAARKLWDIREIIGEALARIGERKDQRKIVVSLPSKLPLISVDFVLMVQVLVNVLDNAIKFSAPDSPIDIEGSIMDASLKLVIADSGIGIDSSELHRVFDKFYRGMKKGKAGGSGLGLSICKGFVEAHDGKIWAESRPDGGTQIMMLLPMQETTRQAAS